jgi:hypothetical protein
MRRRGVPADHTCMAATEDIAVRRRNGEAALHEAIARAHEERATMSRRLGLAKDADDASHLAAMARKRADALRAGRDLSA